MEKNWSMIKILERRQGPIFVLGSSKAQSKPTHNKGLKKREVRQVLTPYLRGPQLESSHYVASAMNPSNQHSVRCVHGVAPLYILPKFENNIFTSSFETLPLFSRLSWFFKGIQMFLRLVRVCSRVFREKMVNCWNWFQKQGYRHIATRWRCLRYCSL